MKFTKMQGIGNDYVYVNCLEETVENPGEVARKVSDRHFGIGSDGLILIKPSLEADFEMDMYNSDGSQGAMCGNGIRCVAKYVYDYGLTDKDEISIATKSGIKYVKLQVENGKVKTVRVDMGAPILNAGLIPIVSENPQVINEAITAGGREYRMTGVSMGNPHAVVYIDDVKVWILKKSDRFLRRIHVFRIVSTQNFPEYWTIILLRCVYGNAEPVRHLPAEPVHVRWQWHPF